MYEWASMRLDAIFSPKTFYRRGHVIMTFPTLVQLKNINLNLDLEKMSDLQ